MSEGWYVRKDGKTYGPLSTAKVTAALASGKLAPTDQASHAQAGPYAAIATYAQFAPAEPAPVETPPAFAEPDSPPAVVQTAEQSYEVAIPAAMPAAAQNYSPVNYQGSYASGAYLSPADLAHLRTVGIGGLVWMILLVLYGLLTILGAIINVVGPNEGDAATGISLIVGLIQVGLMAGLASYACKMFICFNKASKNLDPIALERGLAAHTAFWRLVGIMMLVSLVLMCVVFCVGFGLAGAGSRRRF